MKLPSSVRSAILVPGLGPPNGLFSGSFTHLKCYIYLAFSPVLRVQVIYTFTIKLREIIKILGLLRLGSVLCTIVRTLYDLLIKILIHDLRSTDISSVLGPMTSKKSSKLCTTMEIDLGVRVLYTVMNSIGIFHKNYIRSTYKVK
jgi:hypothetical protein